LVVFSAVALSSLSFHRSTSLVLPELLLFSRFSFAVLFASDIFTLSNSEFREKRILGENELNVRLILICDSEGEYFTTSKLGARGRERQDEPEREGGRRKKPSK